MAYMLEANLVEPTSVTLECQISCVNEKFDRAVFRNCQIYMHLFDKTILYLVLYIYFNYIKGVFHKLMHIRDKVSF